MSQPVQGLHNQKRRSWHKESRCEVSRILNSIAKELGTNSCVRENYNCQQKLHNILDRLSTTTTTDITSANGNNISHKLFNSCFGLRTRQGSISFQNTHKFVKQTKDAIIISFQQQFRAEAVQTLQQVGRYKLTWQDGHNEMIHKLRTLIAKLPRFSSLGFVSTPRRIRNSARKKSHWSSQRQQASTCPCILPRRSNMARITRYDFATADNRLGCTTPYRSGRDNHYAQVAASGKSLQLKHENSIIREDTDNLENELRLGLLLHNLDLYKYYSLLFHHYMQLRVGLFSRFITVIWIHKPISPAYLQNKNNTIYGKMTQTNYTNLIHKTKEVKNYTITLAASHFTRRGPLEWTNSRTEFQIGSSSETTPRRSWNITSKTGIDTTTKNEEWGHPPSMILGADHEVAKSGNPPYSSPRGHQRQLDRFPDNTARTSFQWMFGTQWTGAHQPDCRLIRAWEWGSRFDPTTATDSLANCPQSENHQPILHKGHAVRPRPIDCTH